MKTTVTFTYLNQQVSGILSSVSGAGANASMYHLQVDGFYWGQLVHSNDQNRWFFHSQNKPELEDLADYFAQKVISLTEGN